MSDAETLRTKVSVKGDFSGNLVAGNYNLVVNNPNGGVVNVVQPSMKAEFSPRPGPINLRPRSFRGLLDRKNEIELAKAAILASASVTLFGESGIGKTSLLRNIAFLPEAGQFQDGIAYVPAREVACDDLLQKIFDVFFTSAVEQKATDAEIRNGLKDIRALVILDDLTVSREDVTVLLDAMPQSLVVLASEERALWGEGQPIGLDGLPEEESLQLFQRELGRTLADDERTTALQICRILLFHPLRILQSASLMREDGVTIQQLFQNLTATQTQSPAVEAALKTSSETQKKVLSVLAVAGGFALTREPIKALAASPALESEIKALIQRGLVLEQGTGLSLSGDAVSALTKIWDLSGWEDALINHFTGWLKTAPQDMLVDQLEDVLYHLLKRTGEKKQWPQLVTLGNALERFSILRKKWQRWLQILELLRKAAQALADKKLEGWVLHQLGTRSMCLGAKVEAQGFFEQALNIRHAIGDKAGLQVTQNNLNLLKGLPVATKSGGRSQPPGNRNLIRWVVAGGVGGGAIILAGAIALSALIFQPPNAEDPTQTPPPSQTATFTSIPPTSTRTATRVFTSTPTRVPTRTSTPTITLTPAPVVLYDFVGRANEAQWENARNLFTLDEQVEPLTFSEELQSISPEAYVSDFNTGYVGWEREPNLEDGSEERLVLLSYPAGESSRVSGYYDLSDITLQPGDELVLRIGHRFPDGEFPFDEDGLTFQVIFYIPDEDFNYLLVDERDFYDGKVLDLTIPITDKLAGFRGWFVLQVLSGSDQFYDWAAWMDAALVGVPR